MTCFDLLAMSQGIGRMVNVRNERQLFDGRLYIKHHGKMAGIPRITVKVHDGE
jgi:hypothetical protein